MSRSRDDLRRKRRRAKRNKEWRDPLRSLARRLKRLYLPGVRSALTAPTSNIAEARIGGLRVRYFINPYKISNDILT